ncbi:hypothetical protein [Spirosoma arcticum]
MSRSLPWLATCLVLTGAGLTTLVWLNSTHFTSVDSGYYLQSAANLLAGRGYVVEQDRQWVWNGTFPIGYPALIAVFSSVTDLPVLWASKLVNGAALVLSALLWLRRVGPGRTIWMLSVWWTGGFLRVLAYTWSETLFLVLLAEWIWELNSFLQTPTLRWAIRLILLSSGLFLVRYVGGYAVGLMLLLSVAIYLIPNQVQCLLRVSVRPKTAGALLGVSGIVLAGMGVYSWINYLFSGSLYGGERLLPTASAGWLIARFARSIGNELLLIRDFLPGSTNELAWVGVVVQMAWLWLLGRQFRHLSSKPASQPPDPSSTNTLIRLFVLAGGLYILVLFGLRLLSPFNGPDARLMAPATFCFLTAGLLRVGLADGAWQRKLRPYWLGLLVCSWLQLLPQADFNAKLARVRALISITE